MSIATCFFAPSFYVPNNPTTPKLNLRCQFPHRLSATTPSPHHHRAKNSSFCTFSISIGDNNINNNINNNNNNNNNGGNGGGSGNNGDGENAGDKNREEAMMVLAEAKRSVESLPKDLAAAIKDGKIPGAVVKRYFELEKYGLFSWLMQFGGFKERLLADDLFFPKVFMECGVGVFTKRFYETLTELSGDD